MRTIQKEIFLFNELSKEAQERVVSNWRFDEIDNENLKEFLKEQLKEKGFVGGDLSYSLYCSQGDGVSFTGNWQNKELENILNILYNNEIPKNIKRLIPFIELNIKRGNSHYCHERSVYSELDFIDYKAEKLKRIDKILDNLYNDLENYRLSTCAELEKQGYEYIEYVESFENVKEACEANEYEFYANGDWF